MKIRLKFECRSLKLWLCILLGSCFVGGALPVMSQSAQAVVNSPAPLQWPKEFIKDGTRLVIYQPQLQTWQKFRDLTVDTAIKITPNGGKPALGIVSWHATTLADTQTRIVVIKDIVITSIRFPSLAPNASATMEQLVHQTYPRAKLTIGLDRLLSGVQAPGVKTAISTQPPAIFVSTSPAILLFVDGSPIRVPIEGTKLEYVVNTNWDILYDKSDYYLLNQKSWLKAKELQGPWTVTSKLPPDMAKLPSSQNWGDVRKAVPPSSGAKYTPKVFFSTKPAELLLLNGKPVFKRIVKTNLAYATNTENDVFEHNPDHQIYVLLSGRWFRATTLDGPWSYASNDLPADFASIPISHPKGHVLASIPGTQAAHDAILLAQVPTTVIVNRAEAEAKVKVVYTGEPQFIPVENTTLFYAVNTTEKVIRYGDLYYLCFQGVWFVSASPNGSWKTADFVPKAIYEIPPNSPVYNITYVTVTNPTPTTVECSYTSGYLGVFVVGTCIVYGTGYYYPPYFYWGPYPYPIYYPYPCSYGYRYNPATGFYAVGGAVYGPYGTAGRAAWYNPSTGVYGRATTVQTAYGGRTVAQAYNPWTGTYGATAQGHNPYAQWGTSVVQRGDDWVRTGHVSTDKGTVAKYKTSEGGSGTIISGQDGKTGIVKTADDTIYAGKDGNVYKRGPDGNWSKYDDGNWTPVEKSGEKKQKTGGDESAAKNRQDHQGNKESGRAGDQAMLGQTQRQTSVPSDTMQQLNRDARSRQQGAWREQMHSRGFSGAGARVGRQR